VALDMAGFAAHAQRPPRDPAQGRGEKAMARLRQLAGQMGLSPVNCRKVVTACI